MRTSYSALDTYKQCPQKYKFQEIDRIPAPKSKEAVFGTIIHNALKFMFEKSPLYPTLDEVLGYFRENLEIKKSSWQNDYELSAYHDEGIRMLKNFYAKNAPWNFAVVDLESKFEVPIHDEANSKTHVLAGKIDRIDKLDDGKYEIIDYKTARKLPAQEKVDADLQLSIYSLGLQKKWPRLAAEDITLSLYFLKHGEKLSTVRTKEETEATKEEILSTIADISKKLETGERFEPSPSPLCDWCSYKPICPAWRHLYRNTAGPLSQDEIQLMLKEYFELAGRSTSDEKRLAEIKQKIREYMEHEGYDRVFGEDGSISRSVQKRYGYDFEKVRALLEPIGKWQEILAADEGKLKLVLKNIPPDIREKIEEARILTKEWVTLSASAKKIKGLT